MRGQHATERQRAGGAGSAGTLETTAQSRQRSLEQERAGRAWDRVSYVRDDVKKCAKEYGSLARGAPAQIQANGLGQTLAFWRAKGYENHQPKKNDEHYQLLEHLSAWLRSRLKLGENKDLVEWIAKEATTDRYRHATTEAIAFLGWVKRFAEAELPKGESAREAEA